MPGLRHLGLDERQLVWINADKPVERLWATEQLIKANAAGMLVSWLPQARQEQVRRLQVCAQSCDGPVILCRPASAAHEASAAPLRLQARLGVDWELHVHLLKRKGPPHEGELRLPSIPGGLEAVLTPRLRYPSRLIAARQSRELSMLWAALLPGNLPDDPQRRSEALDGLATWCLQFTPRVAVLEALLQCPAVVMEMGQSLRLFGGKRRLVERVREESTDLGVRQWSWAPTSLAALAVARAGMSNGFAKPLAQLLDALPLETLTEVATHQATLARLGCRTLGQVRALPRGGLSRRFDSQLLATLDQAYGLRPETYPWAQLLSNPAGRFAGGDACATQPRFVPTTSSSSGCSGAF